MKWLRNSTFWYSLLAASAVAAEPPPPKQPAPSPTQKSVSPADTKAPPPAAPATPAPTTLAPASSAPTTSAPASAKATISGTVKSMPVGAAKLAVVYLENAPNDRAVEPTINNKQMNFVPEIAVVTIGASAKFTNADPFPHNVFSPDHEKFDIGQIPQHAVRSHKFQKPGAYTLLCNLHPNMKGYVVVVPSSYFARVDAKGNFTLQNVPAGTYRITAWAPRVQTSTQTVTVAAAGTVKADFDLHR